MIDFLIQCHGSDIWQTGEFHLSPCTVNRHRENVKAKIGASTVAEMVSYWYQNNLK